HRAVAALQLSSASGPQSASTVQPQSVTPPTLRHLSYPQVASASPSAVSSWPSQSSSTPSQSSCAPGWALMLLSSQSLPALAAWGWVWRGVPGPPAALGPPAAQKSSLSTSPCLSTPSGPPQSLSLLSQISVAPGNTVASLSLQSSPAAPFGVAVQVGA